MQEDQYNHQEVSTEQDRAYSKKGQLEFLCLCLQKSHFPIPPQIMIILHNAKYKPLILTAVHLVAKTSNGSEAKGDLVVTKPI